MAQQVVEGDKAPMPTAGMQAIAAICSQAGEMMKAAASFRPSGLGNIVTGNNAAFPPPAQRVSGVNAETLAALAGLAKAATPPKQEEKKSEKKEKEEGQQKPAASHAVPEDPSPTPSAPEPKAVPQAKAKPPVAAPAPQKPVEEHPRITLPEVKVNGDAKRGVVTLDPVVLKADPNVAASEGIY